MINNKTTVASMVTPAAQYTTNIYYCDLPSLLFTIKRCFVYITREVWDQHSDPRVRDLPLLENGPWTVISILIAYLIFVKKIGPELMKNREPFELRKHMLVYNVLLIILNAYFIVEIFICIRFGLDLLNFEFPSRTDTSPRATRLIYSGYAYFLTKFVDLFDTVFFVMRKKYSQVTMLHLYHHTIVPFLGWLALKITPTAAPIGIFPIVNSAIHVIMYTYYALSSMGPQYQKYLWWKKYLTLLQMYQFILYSVYYCVFIFLQHGYPTIYVCFGFIQPPLFFYLFYTFYRHSYCYTKIKRK